MDLIATRSNTTRSTKPFKVGFPGSIIDPGALIHAVIAGPGLADIRVIFPIAISACAGYLVSDYCSKDGVIHPGSGKWILETHAPVHPGSFDFYETTEVGIWILDETNIVHRCTPASISIGYRRR